MPDPNWTQAYNTAQSPESNGFTRTLYNSPIVTEVTSGNPDNRRVEINSDSGDAVFLTSQVPALDLNVGATAEIDVQCSGAGDAGCELTFLNAAILLMVWDSKVSVGFPSGETIPGDEIEVATASNNALVKIRLLINTDGTLSVYREGSLIIGPVIFSDPVKAFQRVLWWGEGGGTQIFKGLRYYLGGPVIPG